MALLFIRLIFLFVCYHALVANEIDETASITSFMNETTIGNIYYGADDFHIVTRLPRYSRKVTKGIDTAADSGANASGEINADKHLATADNPQNNAQSQSSSSTSTTSTFTWKTVIVVILALIALFLVSTWVITCWVFNKLIKNKASQLQEEEGSAEKLDGQEEPEVKQEKSAFAVTPPNSSNDGAVPLQPGTNNPEPAASNPFPNIPLDLTQTISNPSSNTPLDSTQTVSNPIDTATTGSNKSAQ